MKKVLLLVVILLVVAGSIVYLVEVETPELGAAILLRAREATGISLSASESRLGLRRGLSLERVEASSSFPGGRYRVSLQAIELRCRLWTLLTGRVKLSEVVLVEPRVEVILGRWDDEAFSPVPNEGLIAEGSQSTATAGAKVPAVVSTHFETEISEIELLGGAIVLRDQGQEENRFSLAEFEVRFEEFGLDNRALTMIHGLKARGQFGVGALKLETAEFEDIVGKLVVDRGRFTMDSLALTTPLGTFEGNVSLDFNVIPFRYRISLVSSSVTLPGVGSGALELLADGFGTDSRNMSGEGRLDLAAGAVPRSPLRGAIENVFDLDLATLGRATIPFRLDDDRIRLEGAQLVVGETNLNFEGSFGLEGTIDLAVTTAGDKEIRLTGTLDAPETH